MTIWVLAVLLLGIFGSLGFKKGAIRGTIILVGVVIAAFLAMPVGRVLQGLLGLVGLKDPLWLWLLGPVVAFILMMVVITILAFVGHKQLVDRQAHKFNELQFLQWQRLNQRLGACIGIVTGIAYLLLLSVAVYSLGYLTVQVASADGSDPLVLRLWNKARLDMEGSGMSRTVAPFDPTPDPYYDAADVLALLYHNPDLSRRLASYPPFITLSERTEFQELAGDAELNNLIRTKGSSQAVLNHPKVKAIVANSEITSFLHQTVIDDVKDLKEYARSGASPKYDEEPLLGRWEMDRNSTLVYAKKKMPNMSAKEMIALRTALSYLQSVKLLGMLDNKVAMKVEVNPEAVKALEAAAAAAIAPQTVIVTDPAQSSTATMTPEMQRRYGVNRGGAAPAPAAPVVSTPTPAPAAVKPSIPTSTNLQGTWTREGGKYVLKFQDQNGQEHQAEAFFDKETLVLTKQGDPMRMIFDRVR